MSKLVDFLTEMAVSPIKQAQFSANSAQVLAECGFSSSEKSALLHGDGSALALVASSSIAPELVASVKSHRFLGDPGPDPTDDPCPSPEE